MCQTTTTQQQQQQTNDIETSLKTPVSILRDTSSSDSKRQTIPKSILRDSTVSTDSRQTTTKSILKNSHESSYLPVTHTDTTDPNSSYKNSTPCSFCTMLSIVLTFALVLGWFAMLAHGFEVSAPTLVRRPHMATANLRSFDWTLGATNTRHNDEEKSGVSRRSAMATTLAIAAAASGKVVPALAAPRPNGLILSTAPTSGLRWADAKVGTGELPSKGAMTSIDYSMASTAGRFPTIYSTKNGDAPYRWRMGDGSTIRGIELAILGDASEGIPPMRPGGIRRVIVPNNLGYNALIGRDEANNVILGSDQATLSPAAKNQRCVAGAENSLGPIPPKEAPDGAYQRWYQFYCNPRIPYQPDLVLDIKLYGKRA